MSKVNRIVVGIFLSFLSFPLSAQQKDFLHEVALGVNGGINFHNMSFKYNDPSKLQQLGNVGMELGGNGGITVRYISAKHFGVQLEVNWMRGGWKETFSEGDLVDSIDFSGVEISRRLNYIDIPLLAHIYFGKKVRFFVNLGPKLGILTNYGELNNNFSETQLGVFSKNDPRISDNSKHNRFDYALTGGGGFDFQIGRLHAIVEGRYTYGFGDLYSNSKRDIYQRSANRNIALTMAFLLPVKTFYGD